MYKSPFPNPKIFTTILLTTLRNPGYKVDNERSLFLQSNDLPYYKEYEFPRSRLELLGKVGSGQFGEVGLYFKTYIFLRGLNPHKQSPEGDGHTHPYFYCVRMII